MAESLQTEFQQPLRLAFHFGNVAYHILVQPLGDDMRIDVGHKSILIFAPGGIFNQLFVCLILIEVIFHIIIFRYGKFSLDFPLPPASGLRQLHSNIFLSQIVLRAHEKHLKPPSAAIR